MCRFLRCLIFPETLGKPGLRGSTRSDEASRRLSSLPMTSEETSTVSVLVTSSFLEQQTRFSGTGEICAISGRNWGKCFLNFRTIMGSGISGGNAGGGFLVWLLGSYTASRSPRLFFVSRDVF